MKDKIKFAREYLSNNASYIVWGLATGSVIGSLYFSEVRHFQPCELCWYTRILMYPVAIMLTYILMQKNKIKWQGLVLSFAIPALLLGAFHSLLQWGIISESLTECSARSAVSCADPEIMWFGFITIPFLGFLTNLAIIILTLMSDKKSKLSKWLTKTLS